MASSLLGNGVRVKPGCRGCPTFSRRQHCQPRNIAAFTLANETNLRAAPRANLLAFGGTSFAGAPPAAINLRQMIVPPGKYGRHIEFPMRPTYITIHSTDNRNATALQHGIGMQRGRFVDARSGTGPAI
jgi:hypothetical protein